MVVDGEFIGAHAGEVGEDDAVKARAAVIIIDKGTVGNHRARGPAFKLVGQGGGAAMIVDGDQAVGGRGDPDLVVTAAHFDGGHLRGTETDFGAVRDHTDPVLGDGQDHAGADAGEIQGRGFGAVAEGIGAEAGGEDVGIVAVAAGEGIGAATAVKDVVAAIGEQAVVAVAAGEGIGAGAAGDAVVAGAAVNGHVAGGGGALAGQGIVPFPAGQHTAGGARGQGIVAGAAIEFHRYPAQAAGVDYVVPGAAIGHHLGERTGVGMAPLAIGDLDGRGVTGQGELFAAVGGIEVFSVLGPGAGMEIEDAAVLMGELGLDLGGLVVEREKIDVEDGPVNHPGHDLADKGDGDADIHKDIGLEIPLAADVDQVGHPARGPVAGIIPHGHQLGDPDAAVVVDVLEIETGLEADSAAESGLHQQGPDGGLETDFGAKSQLVLVIGRGTGQELVHRPVGDKEAVKGLPPVAGLDGLLDPVGVVAETQIGADGEAAHRAHVQDHRPGGDGGDELPELHLVFEQGQLVGEEDGVAAGDELHPVADIGEIADDLETAAVGGAAATGDVIGDELAAHGVAAQLVQGALEGGRDMAVILTGAGMVGAQAHDVT